MGLRTKLFQLFPWIGGVNTSLDASTIPSNQLTEAVNVIFGTRGSRKKRDGINFDYDSATSGSASVIGGHDFWFGATSRTQRIVSVLNNKTVYSYNSGTRSSDLFAGTAWAASITKASFETMNNLCIIAVDGTANAMKKWSGSGNIADLGGTPPEASICRQHLGRLWTNDKTNLDRIHYSTTGNPEEWNGAGDSGALDIGIGDGDPEGITAIFPTLKGTLFVAKRTKLYRIDGLTPDDFKITQVSNGIGCVSHNAVAAIDQDDIVFMSQRGIHSLAASDTYGDFEGQYLSADIQETFNEDFVAARLKYAWAAYDSSINSVGFAVTDETYSDTANRAIWLYNFSLKAWYLYPNISCDTLFLVNDADQRRFYIGTSTGRIAQTKAGTNYDTTEAGAQSAITFRVRTGFIYVDENPYTIKGFKKIVVYYRPVGTSTVTVTVKIDNYAVQAAAFSSTSTGDLLGSTFILGTSPLGQNFVLGPYTNPIDGYGRGIQVTISQSGTDEQIEVQGIGIEYEAAGTQQEVTDGEA